MTLEPDPVPSVAPPTRPGAGPRSTSSPAASGPANRVVLRGRVSTAPQERELPSGTLIVTLRLSVPREESTAMVRGSRQSVDWVDCSVWSARARRSATRWRVGDVVEVEGALRRRFHRAADGATTRLEIEVLAGRIIRRAA